MQGKGMNSCAKMRYVHFTSHNALKIRKNQKNIKTVKNKGHQPKIYLFLLCDIIYTIGWLIDNLIKLVLLNSTTTTNFKRWNRSYTIMYNTRQENRYHKEIKYFIQIYYVYFNPKSKSIFKNFSIICNFYYLFLHNHFASLMNELCIIRPT